MTIEKKILEMLTNLTVTVDKHGELLAKHGELLAKQGELLAKQGEQLAKRGEQMDRLEKRVEELDARSLKSAVLLETDVARDIHLLYEGYGEIKRKLDTLATKEQVEELADSVEVIKEVVSRHSVDINKLKKAQ